MKTILFTILLSFSIKSWALSFQCKGEGIEFFVRNLNPHLIASSYGTMNQNNPNGYVEYKGQKIMSVSMSKSKSSANENNMQTFMGTSFNTYDKKSNLSFNVRFYGDAQGKAKENIRSWVKIFDSTKRGQDPEYFLLDSCVEVQDTADHVKALQASAQQAASNKEILSQIAKAPASKERQKNKEVCTEVKKERSQSAIRGILGEPKDIQKSKGNGFEDTLWVYENGLKVKFNFMEAATEITFPESMANDCLYYRFEADLSKNADKCVSEIKASELNYEKIKDCYLAACKKKSTDWTDSTCESVLNLIRPNAKNLTGASK